MKTGPFGFKPTGAPRLTHLCLITACGKSALSKHPFCERHHGELRAANEALLLNIIRRYPAPTSDKTYLIQLRQAHQLLQ